MEENLFRYSVQVISVETCGYSELSEGGRSQFLFNPSSKYIAGVPRLSPGLLTSDLAVKNRT